MEDCNRTLPAWRRDGVVWIAASLAALTAILAMAAVLGGLIGYKSFAALWPSPVELVHLHDGPSLLGVRMAEERDPDGGFRVQYKTGNRDLNGGADFVWIHQSRIRAVEFPADAAVVTRTENGVLLAQPLDLAGDGSGQTDPRVLETRLIEQAARWRRDGEPLRQRLTALGEQWQDVHHAGLKARYELERARTAAGKDRWREKVRLSDEMELDIKARSLEYMARFNAVKAGLNQEKTLFRLADGREVSLPLASVIAAGWPNSLSFMGKVREFAGNAWNFLSQYPREANTEGGLFPALFGTVMLVFIMAISAFPLGVAAGVYLREYARDSLFARSARIAVNNLAGVPSIVYGIFGLGFFIYGVGGGIDALIYPERVAAGINTFGGGGILWSSLTLGLLTLPVVIVATEEALATIPADVRQGSLALGATRFQTLWRVILPMASPGIMTGFILAMARAAGEVAPLMLTGAVKSAHALPLDGVWPFVHLERKFMHLGFHIYDMGFQSPNVEASKPLVYLTALVLLLLVFILNYSAFHLRKRMREKYALQNF